MMNPTVRRALLCSTSGGLLILLFGMLDTAKAEAAAAPTKPSTTTKTAKGTVRKVEKPVQQKLSQKATPTPTQNSRKPQSTAAGRSDYAQSQRGGSPGTGMKRQLDSAKEKGQKAEVERLEKQQQQHVQRREVQQEGKRRTEAAQRDYSESQRGGSPGTGMKRQLDSAKEKGQKAEVERLEKQQQQHVQRREVQQEGKRRTEAAQRDYSESQRG
ncbi:hypothetical protein, partial [Amycolatopsis sp. cmx-4-54]|uniref:hypothetical protein n=1 Tax=Amycolatopsis sp. cmx-4-54 TaxID=2790936 RepID=UPI00397AFB12